MIKHPRSEPDELRGLRSLNGRMTLQSKDKQYYANQEKGFQGELLFDQWLTHLSMEAIVLNGLLFTQNNSVFQIDTLLLTPDTVYLFEVKHYEGNFYMDGDYFYTAAGIELKNPLLQLKRTETLLRQTFQQLQLDFTITPYVVFINPAFTLYNASLHLPFLFPTQLNPFLKKLNTARRPLPQRHKNLAERLISMQLQESPYTRLPAYHYDSLKKGMLCPVCFTFLVLRGNKLICEECGTMEDTATGIMRSVREFEFLFPGRKITTPAIFDWCGMTGDKQRVSRILKKHLKYVGYGRSSYYVDPERDT